MELQPFASRRQSAETQLYVGQIAGYMKILAIGEKTCEVEYLCCGQRKQLELKYTRYRIRHFADLVQCGKCSGRPVLEQVKALKLSPAKQLKQVQAGRHVWHTLNWELTTRSRDKSNY